MSACYVKERHLSVVTFVLSQIAFGFLFLLICYYYLRPTLLFLTVFPSCDREIVAVCRVVVSACYVMGRHRSIVTSVPLELS